MVDVVGGNHHAEELGGKGVYIEDSTRDKSYIHVYIGYRCIQIPDDRGVGIYQ